VWRFPNTNTCSTLAGVPQRSSPQPDRLVVASLQGAASRHAGWSDPEGDARAAAVAELREIAAGRADLLAEAAGVCKGFDLAGDPSAAQYRIMAGLLIDAGADVQLLDHWTEVGKRRARPQGTYPV
jgi:hypothetical protein